MSKKLQFGDLLEWNEEGIFPHAIRRKWQAKNRMDPLAVAKGELIMSQLWPWCLATTILAVLFAVSLAVNIGCVWRPQAQEVSLAAIFSLMAFTTTGCLVSGSYGQWSLGACREESVAQFQELLAEAFKWWGRDIRNASDRDSLARMSEDEITKLAESRLTELAGLIEDAEKKSVSAGTIQNMRDHYGEVQETFHELGLVEGEWNRFFSEIKPIDPEEVKEVQVTT